MYSNFREPRREVSRKAMEGNQTDYVSSSSKSKKGNHSPGRRNKTQFSQIHIINEEIDFKQSINQQLKPTTKDLVDYTKKAMLKTYHDQYGHFL